MGGGVSSPKKLNDIDLDKITPELAAKIVKHFILPMFENQPSGKYSQKKLSMQAKDLNSAGSIYGELKLSEKLNDSL